MLGCPISFIPSNRWKLNPIVGDLHPNVFMEVQPSIWITWHGYANVQQNVYEIALDIGHTHWHTWEDIFLSSRRYKQVINR